MTRIAIAVQHFSPFVGGAEQQAALLARMLSGAQHDSQVLTTNFSGELPPRARVDDIPVRRLPSVRSPALRPLVNLLVALVYFLARGHKFDVVHTYCLSGFSLGALIGAQLRGCRTTVRPCTTGCGGDIGKIVNLPGGSLVWRLFRRADAFIAQTPELARELHSNGVEPDKIAVIPNQVDVDWSTPPSDRRRLEARARLELPMKPTVLFLGRLVPQKNLRVVLEAWEKIIRQQDASLVIVGEGPDASLADSKLISPQSRRSIHWLGYQDDVSQYYLASDIFVFSGLKEAYGNVIAEAMAFGLALATTREGVAREYISDGRSGRLFSEVTADELARVIADLLSDEQARKNLGENARKIAISSFSPESIRQHYQTLYSKVLC